MCGWTWLLYETILETRGLTSFFAQSAHIITGWFPENSYPLISLGHLHLNAICQQSGNCPIMIYQFRYCAKVKKHCILATNIMCDYRSRWIPLNLCVMAKRTDKNGPNRWFSCSLGRQWWNEQMLVDKQNEPMSDLLFTVHQHGGDDVT